MNPRSLFKRFKSHLHPGAVVRLSEITDNPAPSYTFHLYVGNDRWLTQGGFMQGFTLTEYYLDRIRGGWGSFVECSSG